MKSLPQYVTAYFQAKRDGDAAAMAENLENGLTQLARKAEDFLDREAKASRSSDRFNVQTSSRHGA